MGTLYVIATPIGNLGDLSPRAGQVLRTVGLIAAEDTRVTRKLLNHLGAGTPCISYHAHSRPGQARRVLAALDDGDVALVSDAGSPTVSDPGAGLVAEAAERGHSVVAVPGPSAVTAALSVSGLPADRFLFLGFLPRRSADRRALLQSVSTEPGTLVCFETPRRALAALRDIHEALGDRQMAVCRELSKLHEEVFRGTPAEASEHFSSGQPPRGEFVLVIAGGVPAQEGASDDEIRGRLAELAATGLAGRRLVDAAVVATGAARSRVYRLSLSGDGGLPRSP